MGILEWLRPKPKTRFASAIARDLAEAVFALHPSAQDRVVVTMKKGRVVSMDVPALDPARNAAAEGEPASQTARISELATELAKSAATTQGEVLTVMRDRVIWMPSVLTFQPAVP